MKSKGYKKPTTQVVELKQQAHLLQTSPQDSQAGVQNYNWNDIGEE